MNIDWSSLWKKEDWWALWISLIIFILSIYSFFGWLPKVNIWINLSNIITTIFTQYNYLGIFSIFLLYIFTLFILSIGAKFMNINLRDFIIGYTFIFFISYFIWILGHYAYISATPDLWNELGIKWSLGLTGDIGYIFALILGLLIANFAKNIPKSLQAASNSFWYIKIGIILLGISLGIDIVKNFSFALNLIDKIFLFSLLYIFSAWTISYFISKKLKLSKEESAIIASGSTGTSISSIIVSSELFGTSPIIIGILYSIILIISSIELLVLPFIGYYLLKGYPIAAGSWVTSSIKTDCTSLTAGVLESNLFSSNGWILYTSTLSKIFIDFLLILWIFILSIIWSTRNKNKTSITNLWYKMPKFIFGFFLIFLLTIILQKIFNLDLSNTYLQVEIFKQFFFLLTFFSIGLSTNIRKIKDIKAKKLISSFLISLLIIIVISLILSIIIFGNITLSGEIQTSNLICQVYK